MKISKIKLNDKNPRFIKDDRFEKLKKSIETHPKFMKLRPIVIDNNNIILGGNMRYRAIKDLGYKEIPDDWIKKADELTEEEKKAFIIKDNVGFGEWDLDIIANEWDDQQLQDWGMDLPGFDAEHVNLPSDKQKEPENFEGFIVVLKIKSETFPLVKERIENICIEHGIEIDIS